MTKILKHNCKNVEQDKLHGEGNRVFNVFNVINGKTSARCTVCGAEKSTEGKKW